MPMHDDTARFFAVTGGPGSGKSTLIAALAARGLAAAPEAGRAIIRDQMAIDGPALPWRDRGLLAELMLAHDLRSHAEARGMRGPVLFDRGIPDIVGYLRLCGLAVPAHLLRAAASVRYAPMVFAAPAWREIFAQDTERRQDFDEAERTFAAVTEAWRGLGYAIELLPRVSVAERADFVAARIAAAGR